MLEKYVQDNKLQYKISIYLNFMIIARWNSHLLFGSGEEKTSTVPNPKTATDKKMFDFL